MAYQTPSDALGYILTAQPVDAHGNASQVDQTNTPPTWEDTTSSGLVTLTPAPDGLSCTVVPTGSVGTYQIKFTCDADLGQGIVSVVGLFDAEIIAGSTVGINFTPTPIVP